MLSKREQKEILSDIGLVINEDNDYRLPVSSVKSVALRILSQLDNNPISQFSQLGALTVLVLSYLTGDSSLLSKSTSLASKTLNMPLQ